MKFKFVPHTADMQFEAYGISLNKVFENSALAMFEAITNTKKVEPRITKSFEIKSEDKESLLYDFLEQLLILHETEDLVFSKFKVSIKANELSAEVKGEKFNKKKHEIRNLVKAITYHNMSIKKLKDKYRAVVVIDL